MDCIIAAGGSTPPGDPLFPYTQGKPKALILLGELTMLERVAAACAASRYVDGLVVVGLQPEDVASLHLPSLLVTLPDQGGLIANVKSGIAWCQENGRADRGLLLSTADIPLLTGAIVDAFVDQCRPLEHMVYYNLVTRETMERRFPDSRRTFVRLRDAEVAGGDILLAQSSIVESNEALWGALANARKHAWRLARIVGLKMLLKLLTRRLTVAEVEETASRMFAAPVRVLLSPFAELAMDADKPHQVELLRRHLATGEKELGGPNV